MGDAGDQGGRGVDGKDGMSIKIFCAKVGNIKLITDGGKGGNGGRGGPGGNGGQGGPTPAGESPRPGPGGRGGPGGDGGDGGRPGFITLTFCTTVSEFNPMTDLKSMGGMGGEGNIEGGTGGSGDPPGTRGGPGSDGGIMPNAIPRIQQILYSFERDEGYILREEEPNTLPFHRYFKLENFDYFYHTFRDDDIMGAAGYEYQGIIGYVYTEELPGTTRLYRYFKAANGDHFYTTNYDEGQKAVNERGYILEPELYFIYRIEEPQPVGTQTLSRYSNENVYFPQSKHHYYTIDKNDEVVSEYFVNFWKKVRLELGSDTSNEWASYRTRVGEYHYRKSENDLALKELEKAVYLDPSNNNLASIYIDQIYKNINIIGLERFYDLVPDFEEHIRVFSDLYPMIDSIYDDAKNFLEMAFELELAKELLELEKLKTEGLLTELNIEIELAKDTVEFAELEAKRIDDSITAINQAIEDREEELNNSFFTLDGNTIGTLFQIGKTIIGIGTAGSTLVGAIAVLPGLYAKVKELDGKGIHKFVDFKAGT